MSRSLLGAAALVAIASSTACLASIDDSLVDRDKQKSAQAPSDKGGGTTSDPGTDKTGTAPAKSTSADGLVGYWSFDEPSGNAVQDATGRFAGVISGAARRTKGVRGTALQLDGKESFSVAALDGAAFPTEGTLAMHVLIPFGASTVRDVGLFDAEDDTRAHVSITMPSGGSTQLWATFPPSASTPTLFALAWDEWQFFVVTWSATSATLYTDGRQSRTVQLSKFSPTEQRFVFGERLTGAIDEIALYDRVLDPQTLTRIR